ncbi:MAG: diphosphomevalonate decarboxylase [Gammaproteobacteria bacterium]
MQTRLSVRAQAHPNIALIKYWGKATVEGNIPAVPSLSITLDTLYSDTTVTLDQPGANSVMLNGEPASTAVAKRIGAFIALLREQAASDASVHVSTTNNFPTAAGLASSASGFAALALATSRAFALDLDRSALSVLARVGSGSAARSLFGGFVEMQGPDHPSPHAFPLQGPSAWPLQVVVAITSTAAKTHLSTDGMNLTRDTSPFYAAWIDSHKADMDRAREAVAARDFQTLASVSEHSCLKMHGLMLSADPGLVYWNAATVACIERVRALRADGHDVFFTIDAGPQVKAVCTPTSAAAVRDALAAVPGVVETLCVGLGGDARVID